MQQRHGRKSNSLLQLATLNLPLTNAG